MTNNYYQTLCEGAKRFMEQNKYGVDEEEKGEVVAVVEEGEGPATAAEMMVQAMT